MQRATSGSRRHEDGATATTFLLVLFVLLGLAMLAIDGGSLLVSRRGQIADTDAAALAAAQRMIDRPCPADSQAAAEDEAEEYAAKNDSTTDVEDVDLDVTAMAGLCALSGEVKVTTEREAALFFAPIFGFDTVRSDAASTAIFGESQDFRGLRPMGICVDEPHYKREAKPWINDKRANIIWGDLEWDAAQVLVQSDYLTDRPTLFDQPPGSGDNLVLHPTEDQTGASYPSDVYVHRVTFSDEGTEDLDFCGDGPSGNFGWLDFDGEPPGDVGEDCDGVPPPRSELNCDVGNGFQDVVSLVPPDCDPTSADTICHSQPGEVSAADRGLSSIKCPTAGADTEDCETIYIVVYDQFSEDDPEFQLVAAIGIVLRDFDTRANVPGDPQNDNHNYLDIEFVDELAPGTNSIGPADPDSVGPLGITLCGTDDLDNCDDGT